LKNKSFPTLALLEEKVIVPKVKEGAVEGKRMYIPPPLPGLVALAEQEVKEQPEIYKLLSVDATTNIPPPHSLPVAVTVSISTPSNLTVCLEEEAKENTPDTFPNDVMDEMLEDDRVNEPSVEAEGKRHPSTKISFENEELSMITEEGVEIRKADFPVETVVGEI
jgi:hypothetical protein